MGEKSENPCREALQRLLESGFVPEPSQIAVCMPCIEGNGYSTSSKWCNRCNSETKKKCEAVYLAHAALKESI